MPILARRGLTAAGALIFWLVAAILPAGAIFPASVLTVLLLQAVYPGRFPAVWAGTVAFLGETFSPFPPFVYAGAFFSAALCGAIVIRAYVTSRSVPGAVAAALVSALIFEAGLLLFSRIAPEGQGWVPQFYYGYIGFALGRVLVTAFALGIIFWIARRISPPVRGVVL